MNLYGGGTGCLSGGHLFCSISVTTVTLSYLSSQIQDPDSNLSTYLQVVLVELEEISPAQLASFPESVQHLRKKQGAVCWWKNHRRRQRWQTHTSGREEEEIAEQAEPISPPLSPDCRFWKEMRYHMPVRSKRAAYPEKTGLLNL